jgi:outer membrane protein TolC
MFRVPLILCFLFFGSGVFSQVPGESILNFEEYLKGVESRNPLAALADIKVERTRFQKMEARGEFDPVLKGHHLQKRFNGFNYFSLTEVNLDVPTPLGIDFKAGFDFNRGVYLSEENFLPPNGLLVAGLRVPLARNILTDPRRLSLSLAELYQEMNEAERRILNVALVSDALKAYGLWAGAFMKQTAMELAGKVAYERLQITRERFLKGESSAIDTLEVYSQYKNRMADLFSARAAYQNALTEVRFYFQNPGDNPNNAFSFLPDTVFIISIPDWNSKIPSGDFSTETVLGHPDWIMGNLKLEMLKRENKLRKDRLKPERYAGYNFITEPIIAGSPVWSLDNYKFGVDLNYPLFVRKERAKLGLNRLQIKEAQLELDVKQSSLQLKLIAARYELQALAARTAELKQVFEANRVLFWAETEKFRAGESTLFLLNQRELAYLESRIKWVNALENFIARFADFNYLAGSRLF